MSDLVRIPEDRFSQNEAHMSLVTRKHVFGVSNQFRHKLGCAATEDGQRLEILDLGSRGSVFKGVDQQNGNRTADLLLCGGFFCICKKQVFSLCGSNTFTDLSWPALRL